MKERTGDRKSPRDALLVLLLVTAAACVSGWLFFRGQEPGEPAASPTPSAVPEKTHVSYWIEEPSDEIRGIRILTARTDTHDTPDTGLEKTGYPLTWDTGHSGLLTEHAIGIDRGGVLHAAFFDGNERETRMTLTDTDGILSYDAVTHCFVYEAGGTTYRVSQDFSTLSAFTPAAGHNPKNRGYALQNGTIIYISGGLNGSQASAEERSLDCGGRSCIIPKVDGSLQVTGYAVYDENGIRLPDGPEGTYAEDSYVNGFYAVETEQGIRLVKASSGRPVSDACYEDILYYEDGYCPVRQNGKWAFLNEAGAQVTDFLFEDVSYAAEGHAYVCIDGTWGLLDLTKMNASVSEAALTASRMQPAGTLEILTETINVRRDAATESEITGQLPGGETVSYYETKQSGGYTWYRIGTDRWIADDGTWLKRKD